MIDYNRMYMNNKKSWGKNVFPMVLSALKFIKSGYALDIGCGQGKEAIFLANKGFKVDALDASSVAIEQLNKIVLKKKIKNIRAIEMDITDDFKIEKNKYDLITCFNVLYLFDRKIALQILNRIKKGLKDNGIVVMSLFSINDQFYNKEKINRFYVDHDEVREIFKDYEIIFYYDGFIEDSGHASLPNPHLHGVVQIIAKKIN